MRGDLQWGLEELKEASRKRDTVLARQLRVPVLCVQREGAESIRELKVTEHGEEKG